MKYPIKKIIGIGSICLAVLFPTDIAGYQGVKTGEATHFNHYGAAYQKEETEKIANGVDHIKISKLMKDGWVDIHVLKVKLGTENIDIKTLRSDTWKKKETLKTMADQSRQTVFGAVNASYFAINGEYSESQGFEYANQQLIHMDDLLRAGLFVDTQNAYFFSHTQKLQVVDAETSEDLGIPVKFANRLPGPEGASLYNNLVYEDSKSVEAGGEYYKVHIRGGKVAEIVPPYKNTQFTGEGYSLVFSKSMQDYLGKLTVGRKIQVRTDSGIALDWLKLAIPGGGYVLQNGEVSLVGELVQPNRRHPRTALGISKDKSTLYMVVIDGRGSSIGATHYELAGYLKELGVSDAIAMDGGASSILLARNMGDATVNIENALPSNHQRKLVNGIAIVSTKQAGEATKLIVTPQSRKNFRGIPNPLQIRAVDANDLPVTVDSKQIYWKVTGIQGTVKDNQFIAEQEGVAEITAYLNDKVSGKTHIEVTGNPIDLQAQPYVLEVEQGKTASFRLVGTDSKGFVGNLSAANATYTLEDETVGYFSEGIFTPSKKGGTSRVTITVGNRSTTAYVVAGKSVNAVPELLTTPVTVQTEGNVAASARQDLNIGYNDSQSLAIAYHFPMQEEPEEMLKQKVQVEYQSPIGIEKEPEKLSMQIFATGEKLHLQMQIKDSQNQIFTASINDGELWNDWKSVEVKLPENMQYPVQILGYGLENRETGQTQAGTLYLDDFSITGKRNIHTLVYQELPLDNLRKTEKRPADIAIFGTTGGKNRILDDIVLEKVVKAQQQAKTALYAGATELPTGAARPQDIVWQNAYAVYDKSKTRIIHLASQNGSYKNADAGQFQRLQADLSNTIVDNIILVADTHPLEESKHKREGEVIHEIVSRYAQSSGKNVYFVAATGYQSDVTLKDGVRYLKTNGLWYQIKNKREIDLNRKFYQIQFYLDGNTLYYDIVNLYPLVE